MQLGRRPVDRTNDESIIATLLDHLGEPPESRQQYQQQGQQHQYKQQEYQQQDQYEEDDDQPEYIPAARATAQPAHVRVSGRQQLLQNDFVLHATPQSSIRAKVLQSAQQKHDTLPLCVRLQHV